MKFQENSRSSRFSRSPNNPDNFTKFHLDITDNHGCQDLEKFVFPDFSRFSLTKIEKFPWLFSWKNHMDPRGPEEYHQGCICVLQFWASENAHNEDNVAFFLVKSSPWLMKILSVWKRPEWRICALFLDKIFTMMVGENFEFRMSENAQNEGFLTNDLAYTGKKRGKIIWCSDNKFPDFSRFSRLSLTILFFPNISRFSRFSWVLTTMIMDIMFFQPF